MCPPQRLKGAAVLLTICSPVFWQSSASHRLSPSSEYRRASHFGIPCPGHGFQNANFSVVC